MLSKNKTRLRRSKRTRSRIRQQGAVRLCFYKSNQHLYAQLIAPVRLGESDKVVLTLSTLGKGAAAEGNNKAAAEKLGAAVATKAKELGYLRVAFDRSGNKYHGKVKSFADAAREGGLEF